MSGRYRCNRRRSQGRIPVDNPTGHFELAMIDESKSLEYSGRGFALMKWGGQMKIFVLMCIFLNVLVAPWGLAGEQTLVSVLLAIPQILFKMRKIPNKNAENVKIS